MQVTNKGIIYALITALCWGFLAIALKVAVRYVSPVTLVWIRFLVAYIILLVIVLINEPKEIEIYKKPPGLVILTALLLACNYFGFITGISYTTPNNAQVFIQIGPMLLALLGIIVYKEKIGLIQIVGFLIAITGLYFFYINQFQAFSDKGTIYNKGVYWVVFAAVSWAAYALTQKKLVSSYSVQSLNLIIFGLPILLFLPFVDFKTLMVLSPKIWLLLIFLGVNTLVAYTFIALALKYTEANKVSIIVTNNPIITFIVMAFLGFYEVSWIEPERMNVFSIIGAALVIAGSVIVIAFKGTLKNR